MLSEKAGSEDAATGTPLPHCPHTLRAFGSLNSFALAKAGIERLLGAGTSGAGVDFPSLVEFVSCVRLS